MSALARVRRRTRLRHRFHEPREAKQEAELRWWLQEWDPVLKGGALNPGDALALLDGEAVEPTYLGRRWQQARAEVRRVLRESAVDDERFFDGKMVVDIGPGPLGFPDACPARVSIGVEPLAERFAELDLLLPDSPALYLPTGAEHIPLLSRSVDVVVARNSLDHVDSPEQVLSEAQRLLRPGGTLILNFDIDHTPTAAEPHALTLDGVRAAVSAMTIVHEDRWERSHGADGRAVVLVARRG